MMMMLEKCAEQRIGFNEYDARNLGRIKNSISIRKLFNGWFSNKKQIYIECEAL